MATSKERLQAEITVKDKATASLKNIQNSIIGIGAAYMSLNLVKDVVVDSIKEFAKYEANIESIKKVAKTTGRDTEEVFSMMQSQLGGLASKTAIAETALKGLTTTLDVKQIGEMTSAIRDASVAMGEDFNVQLPLIIKAIKQLNPAILDNIGVTVRLDQVNKKIRDGYYGAGTAINEYTQQNAIFQEIMKQTAQYQGLEAQLMDTTQGKIQKLSASYSDLKVSIGEMLAAPAAETLTQLAKAADVLAAALDSLSSKDVAGEINIINSGMNELKQSAFLAGSTVEWLGIKIEQMWAAFTLQFDEFRRLGKKAEDQMTAAGLRALGFQQDVTTGIISVAETENKASQQSASNADTTRKAWELSYKFQGEYADDYFKGIRALSDESAAASIDLEIATRDRLTSIISDDYARRAEMAKNHFTDTQARYQEQLDNRLITLEEFKAAESALEQEYTAALDEIEAERLEEQRARYEEQYGFLYDTATTGLQDISNNLIDHTTAWDQCFTNTMRNMAKSITNTLVKRAVDAIKTYIFETIIMQGVDKVTNKNKKTELAMTGAVTGAKIVETTATASLATASGVLSGAMVAEAAVVKTLTAGYISLASAKAAASLGTAVPAILAAAATVQGTLSATLLTGLGFDDPQNDAAFYRWGQDAVSAFNKGFASGLSGPGFGQMVTSNMGYQSPTRQLQSQGDIYITVNVEGSVTSEDFIDGELLPAIDQAIGDGRTHISRVDDYITVAKTPTRHTA